MSAKHTIIAPASASHVGPPVLCPQCGLLFESAGFNIKGARDLYFSGVQEICPRCGAWASVLDGGYDVILQEARDAAHELRDQPEALARAADLARRVARQEITPQAAIALAAKISPKVGSLFKKAAKTVAVVAAGITFFLAIAQTFVRDDIRYQVGDSAIAAFTHEEPVPEQPRQQRGTGERDHRERLDLLWHLPWLGSGGPVGIPAQGPRGRSNRQGRRKAQAVARKRKPPR